jgi:hypothetical protein
MVDGQSLRMAALATSSNQKKVPRHVTSAAACLPDFR